MTRVEGGLWTPYQTWALGTIPTAYSLTSGGNIPTADPGSGALQWSHTLVSGDFPALPPGWTCDWYAAICMCGQNNDGATRNISMRPYLNGTGLTTVTVAGALAAEFWSAQGTANPVAAGDVIGANAFAASAVAVTWDRVIVQLFPSRIRPKVIPALLSQAALTIGNGAGSGVTGVTDSNSTNFYYYLPGGVDTTTAMTINNAWLFDSDTRGWGRVYYSEITSFTAHSATQRQFRPYRGPTQWSGRLLTSRIPT